jgi:hypothetical protein
MLETIYLQSIPGMNESIMEGKATPISEAKRVLKADSLGYIIKNIPDEVTLPPDAELPPHEIIFEPEV